MEKLDKELQQRVWQRVQNREKLEMPALEQENLRPLILSVQENVVAYQNLSRQFQGKDGEKLRRLQQESQKCIACMKGICRVRGEQVKVPQLNWEKEPAKRVLMKCYHRERKLWNEWEQRSMDPDHGLVFGRLAQQAREHCVSIMEVLGDLEK